MKATGKTGAFWFWMIALLGLAIYQIVLIFGGTPLEQEHSSWYSMSQPDEDANMLRPRELFITMGGEEGYYARLTEQDADFEEVFLQAYALLKQVIQKGDRTVGTLEELPWYEEACVLTYEFSMDPFLLQQQLEWEDEDFPEGNWSEIWVLPAHTRRDQTLVYLVDREANSFVKAESNGWSLDENHQLMDVLQQKGSALQKNYFVSSRAWPQKSLESAFVLEQSIREQAQVITVRSEFGLVKKMNKVRAENYAMRFFEYPETVTTKESASQILYNNEKITVKIEENGRLQYVETLTDSEKTPVTMREAYQLACGFLEEDIRWQSSSKMGFYFADYEVLDDQYVFYFNYIICGVPYRMEDEKAEDWHMSYPVKITVEGNKVRRYERYVLSFSVEEGREYQLRYTWLDALDVMAEREYELQTIPKLTYNMVGNRMVLKWEAETEDGRVTMGAY